MNAKLMRDNQLRVCSIGRRNNYIYVYIIYVYTCIITWQLMCLYFLGILRVPNKRKDFFAGLDLLKRFNTRGDAADPVAVDELVVASEFVIADHSSC